jgi:hypothetical protein
VAMGSALIGAWLGFNVTSGPFTILTAIVGVAVGANLIIRRRHHLGPVQPEPKAGEAVDIAAYIASSSAT